MLVNVHLALFALFVLLGLVAAVDLKNYKGKDCKGDWGKCKNIPPLVCCKRSNTRARSGSCQSCNSKTKHGLWTRSSADHDQKCYMLLTTQKGGNDNCISITNAYYDGHMWIYDNPGRRSVGDEWAPDEGEERECVEPDTYSISGRTFQITNTTSKELADELHDLFASDAEDKQIPDHFAALEIAPEDEDEE